jgi:hypothetical protein
MSMDAAAVDSRTTSPVRRYARAALRKLPHLLTLVDRNPLHATYGCFDRQYWHYRTSDFPSGMYQESVLALALAWRLRVRGNRWYRAPRVRELAIAGMHFAARSAHRDGSCDDYYPFERALGATAFCLRACTAAYRLLGLDDRELIDHFVRRADWLARHDEPGRLSNHQALVALALWNTYELTGEERFRAAAAARVDRLLQWQSAEGWFPEYEGCDPGYLTWTIGFLAEYARASRDLRLYEPLCRAVEFARYFQHPDGSFGGEYGSRNTAHFHPHGFELLAGQLPAARQLTDGYLAALARGTRSYPDDDRIVSHLVVDLLNASRDCAPRDRGLTAEPNLPESFQRHFPEAGLYVRRHGDRYAVVGLTKGGVLKLFQGDRNIASNCGLVAETDRGELLVSHAVQDVSVNVHNNGLTVEARMHYASHEVLDGWRFLVFRLGMLAVGRWARDWVRRVLQRRIILGRRPAPVRFRRVIRWGPPGCVTDELVATAPRLRLRRLVMASDATAIYVATSNVYQESSLRPWADLPACVEAFNRDGRVTVVSEEGPGREWSCGSDECRPA